MEDLTIDVIKTKEQFHKNYTLHDSAEKIAKEILKEKGFEFENFGEDNRGEKVWEGGKDKPDSFLLIKDKNNSLKRIGLIDWKGKNAPLKWLNQRAYDSYINWGEKLGLPVYCIIVFVKSKEVFYVKIPVEKYNLKFADHDKNSVVEFQEEDFRPISEFSQDLFN